MRARLILAATLLAAAMPAAAAQKVSFPPLGPPLIPGTPVPDAIPGTLHLPAARTSRVPAVLILHASNGLAPGGPEADFVRLFEAAGIASFVIDMWTPRGIPTGASAFGGRGGPDRRPRAPGDTLPDAFGALKFLADHAAIDPERIGVTGFSWGGALSFDSAVEPLARRALGAGPRFAAHAPQYMVCWPRLPPHPGARALTAPWTGAPMLIQVGGRDDYDGADGGANCRTMLEHLTPENRARVALVVYPDATHSWYANVRAPIVLYDRNSNQGKGGQFRIVPNPKVAAQAREATLSFFRKAFRM